jgi:hypothetical protein
MPVIPCNACLMAATGVSGATPRMVGHCLLSPQRCVLQCQAAG